MKKESQLKQESKIKKNLNNLARDTISLGSIVMIILVIARASVSHYWNFIFQVIAASIIFLLSLLIIKSEYHAGIAIVLGVFTIIFYNFKGYTIFASVVLLLIILSLLYLKYPKKQILLGIILGLISSGIAYYLPKPFS